MRSRSRTANSSRAWCSSATPVDAELYQLPRPSQRVIGPWEDAISRYVGRPLTFLWAADGVVDRTPQGGTVSLVSRASLERLREQAGVGEAIDGRRFRMLFEIGGVRAHEEDTWIASDVQIGEARIAFNGDVGRCVVTSRDPDTGAIDLPTLVTLFSYRPEGHTEPSATSASTDRSSPPAASVSATR